LQRVAKNKEEPMVTSTRLTPPRDGIKRFSRIKLDSVGHILKEMARVYREMRAGIIKTEEGSRLIASLAVSGFMAPSVRCFEAMSYAPSSCLRESAGGQEKVG
jgi:hypothetical protein